MVVLFEQLMGITLCSHGLHVGGGLQAQLFHCHLAHAELLDLAGYGHGELVGELDVTGDLIVGDLATAEVADGFFGGVRVRA